MVEQTERDQVLLKLKEAADYFVSNPKSYLLIPEIRVNIVYALPDAKDEKDVAAIPGRITSAFSRAIYCMPPAFGASDHVARVVLTAMKYNKDRRSAIDIRYYDNIVKKLDDVYIFDRRQEPLESREKEGHTMNFMVDTAFRKKGQIPTYIVDLGDIGKEPTIFILGNDPLSVVKKSLELLSFI
ncbi:thiamine-phosphate synthase family protein [Acidianus brierleyi]|uniref:Phosphomethylpyrimidine kinase n=1 Tax=Acidianus brierleyi TaxID=41673 RepID=A0A2U9IC00_9CREN|nr:thiamine-phosphate synthase family protein [Acidianus brierleyi]AWR93539.1 phosphomethylpyrimidine kinase [Acidianus brierleyi]